MELLDIYKSILKFAGLEADAQGYVRLMGDDSKDQFLVNGKALVLPTDEQLQTMNTAQKMAFHPLAESTIRGESLVIQKLKDAINKAIADMKKDGTYAKLYKKWFNQKAPNLPESAEKALGL